MQTNQPPREAKRLSQPFYDRPTQTVAKELIGTALLRRVGEDWIGGWIVETEAYLGERDPASHSARGKTPRNASMFAAAGTLYVYSIHAKFCCNAVTEAEGRGAAVLIRAIEPVWGIERMKAARGHRDRKRLTCGPAMLCQALGIDRDDDGRRLTDDPQVGIFQLPDIPPRRIAATKRIGISKARHRNLRFVDRDSPHLSRKFVGD